LWKKELSEQLRRAIGVSFGIAFSAASGMLFEYASVGARHTWISVAVFALLAGLLLSRADPEQASARQRAGRRRLREGRPDLLWRSI
jgi:hypothetical protein